MKSDVGGGIHTYHKYMEEALSGMSLTEVEIETTFLDITTDSVPEPIMTTASASVHSDTLILVYWACSFAFVIDSFPSVI